MGGYAFFPAGPRVGERDWFNDSDPTAFAADFRRLGRSPFFLTEWMCRDGILIEDLG
jgi:hypothetical protein